MWSARLVAVAAVGDGNDLVISSVRFNKKGWAVAWNGKLGRDFFVRRGGRCAQKTHHHT